MVPGLLPIFLHGCEIKVGSGLGTRLGPLYIFETTLSEDVCKHDEYQTDPHTHTHAHMHTHMHAHTHMHTRTHTHAHTHIHTHTHTHTQGDECRKQKQLAKAKAWEAEFARKCHPLKPVQVWRMAGHDSAAKDAEFLQQFAAMALVELPISIRSSGETTTDKSHDNQGIHHCMVTVYREQCTRM